MFKKLAIKGHPTRGKEVIELLKMVGGNNIHNFSGDNSYAYYVFIKGCQNEIRAGEYIFGDEDMCLFALDEFLEKFPFKVGDFVRIPEYESEVRICKMKWTSFSDIDYLVYRNDDEEWYTAYELLEYNDNPIKTRDCKKCGLGFGSVRCFDKDCPHNTPKPKSYAVGLKDGKVIECGVNKENVMNEIKPLFKDGDVVKLKGCPDKNLFWIVMDVVKDGYIFNDGKKYSFDVQHHYEKSNIKVINMTKETITPAPDITANITDKNNCDIACPDGYEFYDMNENLIGTKVMMRPKKPAYPKLTNLTECKEILGEKDMYQGVSGYKGELLTNFQCLLIFRDTYLKIAGEELGLGKPWEPDWTDNYQKKFTICYYQGEISLTNGSNVHRILAFPTAEMRDTFYENFKKLIEQCKELL